MLDYKMKYVNSRGDVFVFGDETGVWLDENSLFDYRYDTTISNNRFTDIDVEAVDVSVGLMFIVDSDPEQRNRFTRVVDYDARAGLPGTLWFNDYYIQGIFTKSKPDEYQYTSKFMRKDLTFSRISKSWVKDQVYSFPKSSSVIDPSGALMFPFDYPHDYGSGSFQNSTIENASVTSSDCLIRIFGPAVNPYVVIAGNSYRVNVSVEAFGRLEIDTREKTVLLIDPYGYVVNVYDSRVVGGKKSKKYIFAKVPSGKSSIGSNGAFGYEVTVYEVYSEPKWEN